MIWIWQLIRVNAWLKLSIKERWLHGNSKFTYAYKHNFFHYLNGKVVIYLTDGVKLKDLAHTHYFPGYLQCSFNIFLTLSGFHYKVAKCYLSDKCFDRSRNLACIMNLFTDIDKGSLKLKHVFYYWWSLNAQSYRGDCPNRENIIIWKYNCRWVNARKR